MSIDAARCHLVVGRLIAHPCGRKAVGRCANCDKLVCDRHMEEDGRCVECTGRWVQPSTPVKVSWKEMFEFTDQELALFESRASSPDLALHRYDS